MHFFQLRDGARSLLHSHFSSHGAMPDGSVITLVARRARKNAQAAMGQVLLDSNLFNVYLWATVALVFVVFKHRLRQGAAKVFLVCCGGSGWLGRKSQEVKVYFIETVAENVLNPHENR